MDANVLAAYIVGGVGAAATAISGFVMVAYTKRTRAEDTAEKIGRLEGERERTRQRYTHTGSDSNINTGRLLEKLGELRGEFTGVQATIETLQADLRDYRAAAQREHGDLRSLVTGQDIKVNKLATEVGHIRDTLKRLESILQRATARVKT